MQVSHVPGFVILKAETEEEKKLLLDVYNALAKKTAEIPGFLRLVLPLIR